MSSLTRALDAITSTKRRFNRVNGGELILRRIIPYGFWKVSWDKGELPAVLKGQYLTSDSALRAAKIYLRARGDEVGEEIIEAVNG